MAAARILGALTALWLTIEAWRGHTNGTWPTPALAFVAVIALAILALVIGLGLIDRRPPIRKAPK